MGDVVELDYVFFGYEECALDVDVVAAVGGQGAEDFVDCVLAHEFFEVVDGALVEFGGGVVAGLAVEDAEHLVTEAYVGDDCFVEACAHWVCADDDDSGEVASVAAVVFDYHS